LFNSGYSVPELPLPVVPQFVGDIPEEPVPVCGRRTWRFFFGARKDVSGTWRLSLRFAQGLFDCGRVPFDLSVPPYFLLIYYAFE
jgi:hypothetical protein